MWDWVAYVTAAAALVASHAVLSAPGVRPRLIGLLGRGPFVAAYSTVSTVALLALMWAYGRVDAGPLLYAPPAHARLAAVLLMPVAFLLVVGRLTTRPGPTPIGIYRLVRSPGSAGVLLWALLHLANTGDARRVVLFLAMATIALTALAKNELVRRRTGGTDRVASVAAGSGGRRLVWWHEVGPWRVALALAAYVVVLLAHPYVFGVDPLAGIH